MGCITQKKDIKLISKQYDLDHPLKLILNDALLEISGICFYPKDSSVFAISDENGSLYKIHMNRNYLIKKWKFDKNHDFEDIMLKDSTFYVLESNGNIISLNFSAKGDTIYSRKDIFPANKKNKNEFESLFYDVQRQKFLLICKDCKGDKKNYVSAFSYNAANGAYGNSGFKINVDAIAAKTGKKEIKFKPSAAAIHPKTGDVWILSAVNQLLVVTDINGTVKEVFTLNPAIFTQPEGIAFTPWGDLLISNEAGNKYNAATLFIYKPKIII